MTESRPITIPAEVLARFLGVEKPATAPHELLGLEPDVETWTARAVSDALIGNLRRIDEHPQGRTPEADELRVALHVAAAQLRDPRVRDSLVSPREPVEAEGIRSAEPDPLRAPGAVEAGRTLTPEALSVPSAAPAPDSFRIAASHVLASCGGWNAQSKRMLGYLARSASVDALGLQQALVEITRAHESSAISETWTGQTPSGSQETEADTAPELARFTGKNRPLDRGPSTARARTWMTLGTAAMLLASGVLSVTLVGLVVNRVLTSPADVPTNVVTLDGLKQSRSPADEQADPAGVDHSPDQAAAGILVGTDPGDVIRLLRTLDSEAFAAATADSVQVFEDSVDLFAGGWPEFDKAVLDAAPLAFRDATLAATEHNTLVGTQLVDLLAERLDPFETEARILSPLKLRSSAFGFAMCGLLLDTPIPPRTERALRSRLNSIASQSGAGLDSGDFYEMLETALVVQSLGLVPRAADSGKEELVKAVEAWTILCDALPAPDAQLLKLDALEQLLTDGESPIFHPPTGRVIEELVASIDWANDSDRSASRRLIRWFDEGSVIGADDLSIVTSKLIDSASLPSLGPELKLSPSASTEDRLRLRDQYAVRLGLPQSGEGRIFASDWAGFANELLSLDRGDDAASALNTAVRAAWINESASLWLASRPEDARRALEKSRGSLGALVAASGGPVPFGGSSVARADGEWAARYLQARRSADARTQLLYELTNSGGPAGQADADVLAEAASYSTPIEIRSIAQRAVIDFASRTEVVLGLLEVMPRAAKQDGVSEMIEAVTGRDLPSVDSQYWRTEARKALVTRAMEMLASDENRMLDVAADALLASYAARRDLLAPPAGTGGADPLALESFGDPQSGTAASRTASTILGDYADRLQQLARRHPERTGLFASLDEIDSRRTWRRKLSTGGIAMFASEQTTCVELSAYILASERPELTETISSLIDQTSADRRLAKSVYEQIATNELAALKLNHLRMTGGTNQ